MYAMLYYNYENVPYARFRDKQHRDVPQDAMIAAGKHFITIGYIFPTYDHICMGHSAHRLQPNICVVSC